MLQAFWDRGSRFHRFAFTQNKICFECSIIRTADARVSLTSYINPYDAYATFAKVISAFAQARKLTKANFLSNAAFALCERHKAFSSTRNIFKSFTFVAKVLSERGITCNDIRSAQDCKRSSNWTRYTISFVQT